MPVSATMKGGTNTIGDVKGVDCMSVTLNQQAGDGTQKPVTAGSAKAAGPTFDTMPPRPPSAGVAVPTVGAQGGGSVPVLPK